MYYKFFYFSILILTISFLFQCTENNSSTPNKKGFFSNTPEDQRIANLYFQKKLNTLVTEYNLSDTLNVDNLYTRFLLAKAHYYQFSSQINLETTDQEKIAEKTKQLFQSLVIDNPLFIENYLYLARIDYYFLNNPESALRNLETGLRIESDNIKLLSLLFNIYEKSSNLDMTQKIAQSIILYKPQITKAELSLKKNQ